MRLVWLLVLGIAVAGCGATRSSPDSVTGAGGLTPSVPDREAGLVAVASGFDVARYRVVVVEKFAVTDPGVKDEGDRRFAAKMRDVLQRELVRRLRESGLFEQVIDTSETGLEPTGAPALRLRGEITRLGRGSQAARAFGGLYGAGRARAQADMHLVTTDSNQVVLATADRRVSSYNPWTFGGSDEETLEESFDDLARDFARFLVRLSRGEAPAAR